MKQRISIAMCTYNGAPYLQEQLSSILSQTRLPDELIICDDKSEDNTVDLVRKLVSGTTFPVRLVVNKINLKSTKNFEKAISLCSGNIIALSDQDDVWHPQKLMRIEKVFVDSPHIGAVFTDGEVCDASLKSLGYSLWESFEFNKKMQKKIISPRSSEVLIKSNVVTGATMAFRSEFKDLILPIPDNWVHDGWIVLLIAAVSDLTIIREHLIKSRQHNSNQIGALKKDFKEQFIMAQKTTSDDYLFEAKQFVEARERLLTTDKFVCPPQVICHLSSKICHLEARASLPKQNLHRWIFVLKEFVRFRYHHYSSGWKGFAKDFFGV